MSPPDFDNAATYDAWFQTPLGKLCGELERRVVLQLAVVKAGEKVLDTGCGTGYFTLVLARAGAEVTGIDLSEAMVARARDNARREGLKAEFITGDAVQLPFPPASFDLVTGVTTLCFAEAPERVLREARRVLKPTGRVVIGELNALSPWAVGRRVKGHACPSSYRHAHFFRPAELERLLTESGFLVTERRTLLYFPPLNSRLLLSSYQWFERTGARLFPGGGAFITVSAARRP